MTTHRPIYANEPWLAEASSARHLSATWSCPEHSRLGGQFLASAKQLLIPAKMTVANLTTVNERNGDISPTILLGLLSRWKRLVPTETSFAPNQLRSVGREAFSVRLRRPPIALLDLAFVLTGIVLFPLICSSQDQT